MVPGGLRAGRSRSVLRRLLNWCPAPHILRRDMSEPKLPSKGTPQPVMGGPNFLTPQHVERIAGRPDEAYRQRQLKL